MSQGSLNPKIRFLGQKVCLVARGRTDRQTDTHTDTHESDYCGHPFRVSGVLPSTYHQGSAKKTISTVKGITFEKYVSDDYIYIHDLSF